MSAMANTTPIVTTVTKPSTKEKTPKEADATPRVNIQDFCEEHYEVVLSAIMDKIRRDKRKEVHARLDFEESPKKIRIREGSQNSSARTLSARARSTDLVILTRQAQLNPNQTEQTSGIVLTVEAALIGGTLLTKIILGAETAPMASKNHMIIPAPPMGQGPNMDIARPTETAPVMRKKGGKVNPCHPAYQRVVPAMGDTGSQGDPEDHVKKFQAAAQVERWAMPTWCHMFNATLIGATRKYVKDPVKIHNIKQRDGETIEEFMERFKVETGRMKGAPECMWISGFMHGVNNPELRKCLNKHVPKTMEEMMITTTAFIRGEATAIGKKKGHTSWRTHDQSKWHASERRSDFRGQPMEGRGSSKFTPLTRTTKEILATEAGKFKPPPPMVTPVEKRSSNKFCDFHNDKGHNTDECMQLKKQIEELVRAGKLSHLIKEIKQRRDQPKVGKKEVPAKDNSGTEGPLVIEAEIGGHMIHRMYVDGAHRMLKFTVDGGIVTIRSTILISAECATVVTSSKIPKEARDRHENFKIALHLNFPDQEVAIGGTLSTKGRTELCSLLKENLDIFAWQPSDMTGVPRSIAHQLDPVLCGTGQIAGSENRPPMLNKENYVPWSSLLLCYAKSRPNGKLIYNSIMNGPYVKRMIPEPGDPARTVPIPKTFHEQTDDELTKMMKGSDIGIQEKKAKLFNEWERFTSTDGESIESYYHRFSKLMNDFKRNKHFPEKIASNLKFLNNLQPEWSWRVTIVHQRKDLHTADYTQLYDFLNYNQKEVDELRAELFAKTQDPLALMANSNNSFKYLVFHPDLPSSSTYIQ
ncbi:hypothetical protein Tco_0304338 [Tanacetum coccineum]